MLGRAEDTATVRGSGGRRMAVVPSTGRADRAAPPEADLTRALYERYSTQIFRYCLHQLGSREEAEDAVQSTFLNAFRGIKRGIVPELESAWLFKIAENVCLSRRRSTWRRNRVESPDGLRGGRRADSRAEPPRRRARRAPGRAGADAREPAARDPPARVAGPLLPRDRRGARALADGGGDAHLPRPPLARERPRGATGAAQKRRMVYGADFGNLLTGLKSLLFGGGAAAAKVAAVVAVVSAGTVVAASPAQHHARTHAPAAPAPSAPAASLPVAGLALRPPRAGARAGNAAAGRPRPGTCVLRCWDARTHDLGHAHANGLSGFGARRRSRRCAGDRREPACCAESARAYRPRRRPGVGRDASPS